MVINKDILKLHLAFSAQHLSVIDKVRLKRLVRAHEANARRTLQLKIHKTKITIN